MEESKNLEQNLDKSNKKLNISDVIYRFFNSCRLLHDWGKWQTNGYLYQWRYCKKCNKRQDKQLKN